MMTEKVGALVYEDDQPIVDTLPKSNVVAIERPTYKSNVIDSRYTPKDYLTTFMEGSPWTVNYYSQVLGTSDENSGNVGQRSAPHQQYELIMNFELRVITPLDSQDQNIETKEFDSIEGTANVHPVLIPNKGDAFIADIGDGRAGIFEITRSRKLTIAAKSAYQIDYKLREYASAASQKMYDDKVVKIWHYRSDFMNYGGNPMVADEDMVWVEKMEDAFESMVRTWWKFSFSNETRSIVIPGQNEYHYDPYLTKVMVGFYRDVLRDYPTECRIMNVYQDELMRCYSLWDLMFTRDPDMLSQVFREVGKSSNKNWPKYGHYGSIYHSFYRWVVYPADGSVLVDYQIMDRTKPVNTTALENRHFRVEDMDTVYGQSVLPGFPMAGTPLIKPVSADGYYVLSKDFYTNGPNKSALEQLIWEYIHGRAVDNRILMQILQMRKYFGTLESFYYTPLLMMLCYECILSR